MLRKMPFILLFLIAAVMLLEHSIPLAIKQWLYSISLVIKETIVLLLPFIIFGLIYKATVTLAGSAKKILAVALVFVCCSNFISTFLSHYVGMWVYNFDLSLVEPLLVSATLTPLWSLDLPQLLANDTAMFAGIVTGIVASKMLPEEASKGAARINALVGYVLQVLLYFIPLFVVGFVVKLQYDGVIYTIVKDYTQIFLVVALTQYSYIAFVYFVLNKFNFAQFFISLKHMLPAAVSGFITMSSAASMPLTIAGVESNARNKDIARSVVPATVNIHLVGDCFAIPIFAYAILKSFGMAEPAFATYLVFAFYFVLAKFSVAAIPGGGIMVMLPILENHLGFNAEMMSLITALYILFDPVITCANVLGNGAFAKMIDLYSTRKRTALE